MNPTVRTLRWIFPALVLALLLFVPGVAFAQDPQPPDIEALAATSQDTVTSLNVMWLMLAGFLVFFMQAGFALVETGFTRAKNVAHTMMMNMMVFCIGALGYWLTGFASTPVLRSGSWALIRNLAVIAAINTLLAGAAGGVAAMLYVWLISPVRKPDAGMSVNGILAGLVAVTAPCAFIDPWVAVVVGIVAGIWVCLATVLLEKAKIDDPVGAVPVHLGNGLWGVLAVGIFANGNPDTAAWNGVASPVTGLLYGSSTQILAQLAEALAVLVVVGGLSYVFFKILAAFKLLRVSAEIELAGVDLPEMGAEGYPKDWEPSAEAVKAFKKASA
jgi:ammonia channel protein AmtB